MTFNILTMKLVLLLLCAPEKEYRYDQRGRARASVLLCGGGLPFGNLLFVFA